jgi:hypothetical protein
MPGDTPRERFMTLVRHVITMPKNELADPRQQKKRRRRKSK